MPWLNFAGAWLVVFLVLVAAAMGFDEAIRQLKRWWKERTRRARRTLDATTATLPPARRHRL